MNLARIFDYEWIEKNLDEMERVFDAGKEKFKNGLNGKMAIFGRRCLHTMYF
jgi:hypothetical protein